MSIIDRIMGRKNEPQHLVPAARKTDKNAEAGVFVAPAFVDAIPPNKKDSEYLESTTTGWVYACANAIAIEVASINLRLYKQTSEGPVEITKHPLLDLLYRVNAFTTSYDHWYRTQMYLEGTGEAPWYLQRSSPNAKPTSMILLKPYRLSIEFSEKEIIGSYTYRKDNGSLIKIDAKDIIFLRNPSVMSEFRGMGTVQAAAITIDSEEFAEKWNRNFYYNGARPDFFLKTEKKLSQIVIDRLKKMWESLYKGVNNAHKMAILEEGLAPATLGVTQKDIDFLEGLRWGRDKILAIFQVPKSILGITEDVNRANAEAAYFSFARFTIRPRLERIVQQLNEFLVPQFGDDLYLDYDDPTPDNVADEAAYYTAAANPNSGWMTTNEIRALEGLAPVRGGDTIMRPLGLQPSMSLDKTAPVKEYEPKTKREKTHHAGRFGKLQEKRKAVEKAIEPLALEILKRQVKDSKPYKRTASITKSQKKKELKPYLTTDDERDGFQKMLNVKSVAQFEDMMITKAQASFTQQERIVLENLTKQNTVKLPKVRGRKKDPGDAEARRKAEELVKAIWDTDMETLNEVLNNNLSPVMMELIREQAFNTANYLNLQVGDITGHPEVVAQIQKMTLKLSGDVDATTRSNILKTLEEAIVEGESIASITSRVKAVFEQASVVRSEIIARSEAIRASNYAAEEVYRESGITYKEWITATDERTCPFCASMDGNRIKVGEDFWKLGQTLSVDGEDLTFNYLDVQAPPLHPNCRCTLGPVIET